MDMLTEHTVTPVALKSQIETRRLVLRAPVQADIPALVRELGRFSVSGWLGRVPHPYTALHARQYLAYQAKARVAGRDLTFVVSLRSKRSRVIGGIGAHNIDAPHPVIGYWLAESFWGRGYASEGLRAVLAELFAARPRARPVATAMRDNARSIGVLRKCGFERRSGREWLRCVSRGHRVEVVKLATVERRQPAPMPKSEGLTTPRLALLPADDQSSGMHPYPSSDGALLPRPTAGLLPAWRNFDIHVQGGGKVGTCGLLFREDGGVEVGYRIAPEHRRQGYAREALNRLTRLAFRDYGLSALEAEVAEDNLASLSLLGKLGFTATGRHRKQWSARRNAYITYELHRLQRSDRNETS